MSWSLDSARVSRLRRVAGVLAALLLFTTVSSMSPARELSSLAPASPQLGEASRDPSAPADKVQGAASDVAYVALPDTSFAPPRAPDVLPVSWHELGAFRPGHRQRIDRPPRRGL